MLERLAEHEQTGNVVLALGWIGELPTAGFLPVLWAFVAACLAGFAVSMVTRRQDGGALARAFGARPLVDRLPGGA